MQISEFINTPEEYKRQVFALVGNELGLPPQSIEKDWWVTAVLRAIYSLDYGEGLQFKGLCIATHKPLNTSGAVHSAAGDPIRPVSPSKSLSRLHMSVMLETRGTSRGLS